MVTEGRLFPVRAPVLLLGAEYGERVKFGTPCAPQDANFRKFFEAAPGPALEVEQRGAGHVDYLDNPNCGLLCSVCWPGDNPTTRAWSSPKRYPRRKRRT